MRLLRNAWRVATAAGLVAGAAALAACSSGTPEATPTTTASQTPTASPSSRSGRPARVTTTPPGSVGLDVRYVDHDGTVKTLKVKDFRH